MYKRQAQKPLVTTDMVTTIGVDQNPIGMNVTLMIKSLPGVDEDATVWNRGSIQNGLWHASLFQTVRSEGYEFVGTEDDQNSRMVGGVIRRDFRPELDADSQQDLELRSNDFDFPKDALKLFGLTQVVAKPGDVLARAKSSRKATADIRTTTLKGDRTGLVHATNLSNVDNNKSAKVLVMYPHVPGTGDKFSNRYAQKGVSGTTRAPDMMPFTSDGLVADAVFSPTSFTSRMTYSMLEEMASANAAIVCNKNNIVNLMIGWEPGMPNVVIRKDFYITLEPVFVLKDATSKNQQFMTMEQSRHKVMQTLFADSLKNHLVRDYIFRTERTSLETVSYTHLTLPTTPYV